MIKQVKMWTVFCDECGERYGNDIHYLLFKTKEQLIISLINQNFNNPHWQYKDGKVYCPDHTKY
jgi:hypothetical protein